MKALLLACLLLAAPGVRAQDAPADPPLAPVRLGYAFDRPDILLRQRIFGLAHGVHLLLSACHDKNENADAAQQAYATWHERQRETIGAVLRYVSVTEHFAAMVRGAIDTKSLIYFATMIAGWIFLTQRSVESIRWR